MNEKSGDKLRVVVLVSDDVSDIYFANQLMKKLNVVGVFVEKQVVSTSIMTKCVKAAGYALKPWRIFKKILEARIVKSHFKKTRKVDDENFGVEGRQLFTSPECILVYTEGNRAINEPVYVDEMRHLKPDVIAVCGTSILKRDIILVPSKGVLNLHGGLAQKYRGTCTTLWAIYNGEPEYVGATVHYVSEGIDDGRIIYQGRPEVVNDDDPETLYVKVVNLGITMMTKAIEDIQNNTVESYEPDALGTLYLSKMVTPEVLHSVWEKIESGVIGAYLENREARDEKVLKIMQGTYSS